MYQVKDEWQQAIDHKKKQIHGKDLVVGVQQSREAKQRFNNVRQAEELITATRRTKGWSVCPRALKMYALPAEKNAAWIPIRDLDPPPSRGVSFHWKLETLQKIGWDTKPFQIN